jgi:2-(1,2-epoxy-1,2-dihydrophenyl)acetyl-CoA isomerase
MSDAPVLVERSDGIVTVTINRPKVKNAINGAAWEILGSTFAEVNGDDSVRAVVVTGAGDAFSAGADLSGQRADGHPLDHMRAVNRVAKALYDLPKPTVAKVPGVAVGAGWNLALCCDLVVASTTARFSQIFAKRGLSLDFGGSWLLPRLVGLQQAKRLALLADFVDAEEARTLGLVTWVVEPEKLDAFTDDVMARLAAGPPVALAQSKELLNASIDSSFAQALESEARTQAINFASADAAAARKAFMEKREPEFTGRWGT